MSLVYIYIVNRPLTIIAHQHHPIATKCPPPPLSLSNLARHRSRKYLFSSGLVLLPLLCRFFSLRQKSEICGPPINFWVRKNSLQASRADVNTQKLAQQFASVHTHPVAKKQTPSTLLVPCPIYHLCLIVIQMMMISSPSQRVKLVGLVVVGTISRKHLTGLEMNTDDSR